MPALSTAASLRRTLAAGLAGVAALCIPPAVSAQVASPQVSIEGDASASYAWGAAAAAFPSYDLEACCQLCPAAADPARYQGSFLDSFRTLVQGSDGWLFRSAADLITDFGISPEGHRRLVRLDRALARRGVQLVMVLQPLRGMMHKEKLQSTYPAYDFALARSNYLRLQAELRADGIVVPELEQLVEQGGGENFFFRGDHHWSPEGARRTARVVADRIRQMPEFKQVDKQHFVTTQQGLLARRGTLQKAALQLCGYGSPNQYVPRYVTEAASGNGEASGGGDLFGDGKVPQITLIGTSNSDMAYNFSGFLSEYLDADVLNVAVAGGGMDTSMLSYLSSKEFRNNPPKILIWELAPYHQLSDSLFYRQTLPIMEDGCDGKPIVLERRLTLTPGRNEVLFNGGGQVRQILSKDHVLDLQFSDKEHRDLKADVWYTAGTREPVRIEHSPRVAGTGRFVLQLQDEAPWSDRVFMSLDVDMTPPVPKAAAPGQPPVPAVAPVGPQTLHARLCRMPISDDVRSVSARHITVAGDSRSVSQ